MVISRQNISNVARFLFLCGFFAHFLLGFITYMGKWARLHNFSWKVWGKAGQVTFIIDF